MSIPSKVVSLAAGGLARRAFLKAVAGIKVGSLTVEFPDGTEQTFASDAPGPHGTLRVAHRDFYRRVMLGGEVGFGEAFQEGLCSSPDLVSLIELAIHNRRAINLNSGVMRVVSRLRNRRLHLRRRNTSEGSAENIHAHYDLSNDFFKSFLDETFTYSCAVFEGPGQPLADAQRNKYRMMCEKAALDDGDHVLEIGTGWGGFAIHAAGNYGCRVSTVTISKEQLALAVQRVDEAGLTDKVDVKLCDYRDVTGQFDKIVSIEMFEAVGAEFFETFFNKCAALLKPGGKLVMQVITVPDPDYASQLAGANWIQKYIFPGGILPSLAEMERTIMHSGLVITQVDDIGPHYATTLHQWRERYWDAIEEVRAQSFDERFVRTWDYYLAICEAGFLTSNTSDVQIVFEKPAP